MAEKIATRAAYGEALAALGEHYPQLVVLDADLSGSTMSKKFADKYPERFFNMGIAEANMTTVAAGLSTCGKKVFTNTFAMFAAGRAFEQVRNSIAYPHLNVTVVGSHGGLSVGEDGATHQCCEDYALMRSLPGMLVLSPCDAPEMRQAVWTTRVPPTCAWAAWRWSRSPTERPATASSWARAPCCGTAATSPSSPPV